MSKLCLLEIEFSLLPQKRREFAQSLELLTGSGQGFVRRSVYVDRDEPERVLWVEEWSSREMLEAHMETPAFRALIGGLKVLGNVLDCRVIDFASEAPASTAKTRMARFFRGNIVSSG